MIKQMGRNKSSHVSDVRRSAMVAWGTTCMQCLLFADVTDFYQQQSIAGSTLSSPEAQPSSNINRLSQLQLPDPLSDSHSELRPL